MNYSKVKEDCISWIREWFKTNGDGCKAVIGISGGKDSTVVAALCKEALGVENVIGVAMPDVNQGVNDADEICKYLGIKYINLPIDRATTIINQLSCYACEEGEIWSKQAEQNIPCRIRMTLLYAVAQTYNGRVVGTCNASECYVGYFTRYGDGASDCEPIADLTCRQVINLGKELGLPDKWTEKTPDDGLPNSMKDDDKFAKWGFSYALLDEYIENGTSGNVEVDEAIEKKHKQTKFKLSLGTVFNIRENHNWNAVFCI